MKPSLSGAANLAARRWVKTAKAAKPTQAATITPAGLLSGTPQKQRANGNKGGLLRQIGKFGIVVLKDFGSILAMRPDAKSEILGALREIYDGHWTRVVGSDGGRSLFWQGKLGVLVLAPAPAAGQQAPLVTSTLLAGSPGSRTPR